MKNTLKNLACALGAVAALAATEAKAVLINITYQADGTLYNSPTGIVNKDQYNTITGSNSNNPTTNLSFLTVVQGNYNTKPDPDLPAVGAFESTPSNGSLGGVNTYTTQAGYDYLVLHFGSGQAKGGPWWQAYYLGGEGGHILNLPVVGTAPVGGFSSANYFGKTPETPGVPEGGASVALLGLGLAGLGAIRRFTKKS